MSASDPGFGAKQPPHPPGASERLVAVVTAIPEEFEAAARLVSQPLRLRVGEHGLGFLLKGRMGDTTVLLAMTGDGRARAERGVSFLLGEFPVSLVLGAGAAGALSPSLRAGEIVVSERVLDEAGDATLPEASLVSRAAALGAKSATVLTFPRPVCSSKEKGDLASRFGLGPSAPAVVDMESAAWARAAASRGVPWVILRAVSDTFEEDLPAFLPSCLASDGSVDRAAVARRLLRHPAALPKLLRVRRRIREGAGTLGVFLRRLVPEKI